MSTKLTISQIVKESGYYQRYLARQLDVTPNTFYNKANGWSTFTDAELEQLAQILGKPVDLLREAMPPRRYRRHA